jgi:hypothetical protein
MLISHLNGASAERIISPFRNVWIIGSGGTDSLAENGLPLTAAQCNCAVCRQLAVQSCSNASLTPLTVSHHQKVSSALRLVLASKWMTVLTQKPSNTQGMQRASLVTMVTCDVIQLSTCSSNLSPLMHASALQPLWTCYSNLLFSSTVVLLPHLASNPTASSGLPSWPLEPALQHHTLATLHAPSIPLYA